MKHLKIKIIALSFLSLGLITSCANSDDYDAIDITYQELTPTKTIDDIYAMASAEVQQYTEDDVIEAYVSSSDEGGTFYKSISFQNAEGTRGFSIPVDSYNLYTEVEPGRKVYIKLKDLYYSITHGSLVIGSLYENTSVGRMLPPYFREKVAISAEKKEEIDVSEGGILKTVTIAELFNDNYINTLVEIENVQFTLEAVGNTYYDANNVLGGATNHLLEQTINGTTSFLIFRTSEFAKFAHQTVPANNGKIRGVLTKFNSDYQFLVRTIDDVQLTNPRIHISTAIGGENMSFLTSVNEGFESYPTSTNSTAFDIYGNDFAVGGRFWSVRTFDNNKYIQLTAYGNQAAVTKSYFIVPVAFNGNNTLSFETKDGHYNGDVLNVYYVSADQYSYGDLIQSEGFTNITDQFTYSTGTTSGYANAFVPSGNYTFPSNVTGNGYIIFEYSGSTSVTTTIQIDNILFN